MKKEIGKWLMDIAKYMVTAGLLATIFKDIQHQEKSTLYAIGVAALVTLFVGLFFTKEPKEKK
ncbi:hypothetical protein AGMMS4957_14980 [Bacteroidia bacterium]|nr:hypothetical protein AGMMS4957_14980 [Bacteroidia bacterium]